MHTSIGRLIGHFLEASEDDINDNWQQRFVKEPITPAPLMKEFLHTFIHGTAHYVIDEAVMKLAASDNAKKSVNAMINAGIHSLPFDPILLEFTAHGSHCFVRLQSKPLYEPYKDIEIKESDLYAYPVSFTPSPDLHDYILIACNDPREPTLINFTPGLTSPLLTTSFIKKSLLENGRPIDIEAKDRLGNDVSYAAFMALLLLNTQGLEKVHVDTTKLNKARTKQGKFHINSYTQIHIGHVYDRHGGQHIYTGRHMPVHFRAGHVRNQACGPKLTKHKQIFIQPCLVNYHPEEGGPKPKLPTHEVVL